MRTNLSCCILFSLSSVCLLVSASPTRQRRQPPSDWLAPAAAGSSRGGSSSPSETSALQDSQHANANATKATLLSLRPLRNLLATSPRPYRQWGSAEVDSKSCLFVNHAVATISLPIPTLSYSPHPFLSRSKQRQCLRNTPLHCDAGSSLSRLLSMLYSMCANSSSTASNKAPYPVTSPSLWTETDAGLAAISWRR